MPSLQMKNFEILSRFSQRERSLLVIVFLIFITSIVYYNSLFNLFTYDDQVVIDGNAFITSLRNLPQLFSKAYFIRSGEASYRPMVTFSYMVDYFFFKFRPAGYHLVNMLWHIGNVLAVYWLMNLIFKARITAFLAALFFAIHPVNAEVVNCVGFREDLLFVFFYLAAFIYYIKKKIFLSAVLFAFSLFSKEMAMTFPFLVFAYHMVFERVPQASKQKQIMINDDSCLNSDKNALRKFFGTAIYQAFICYLIILLLFTFIRFIIMVCPIKYFIPRLGSNYYETLFTTLKIVANYILLLFAPFTLSLRRTMEISGVLLDKDVLLSLCLITAILGFGIYNLTRNKTVSFGIFWFFITLVPVYNLVPLFNPIAERYLYLPAIGYYILLALVWDYVFKYGGKFLKKISYFLLILMMICYSFITMLRNFDWKDEETIWTKEIKISPHDWGVHNAMGIVHMKKGQYDLALREFKDALRSSRDVRVYYNMGVLYYDKGELDKALNWWKKTLLIDSKYTKAFQGIGVIFLQKKMYDKAIDALRRATAIDPYYYQSYHVLAYAYYGKKEYETAIRYFKKVLQLFPQSFEALLDLGYLYLEMGKEDEAMYWFNRVSVIHPRNTSGKYAIGRVYLRNGQFEKAVSEFKEILVSNQKIAEVHYYLGAALEKSGKNEQAKAEYEAVKKIDPNFDPKNDYFSNMEKNRDKLLLGQ